MGQRWAPVAAWMALVAVAPGCGESLVDVGDLGRLTYTLHVDYEIDGGLRENKIVTGHLQILDVGLTRKGAKKAKTPGLLEHRIVPGGGAELLFDPGEDSDDEPPAAWLRVDAPGTYVLESWLDDELFDTMPLSFARPLGLDVKTDIRAPGSQFFDESTSRKSVQVVEGTQVAFVAIPVDKAGDRLVGEYDVEVSWSPEWAAIQTYNVLGVYEREGVFGNLAQTSLVFIDAATVVVDLEDRPNGMTDQVVFEVADNGH